MNWTLEIQKLKGWSFGDNPIHADQLAKLVADGRKTGTTGLLKHYELNNYPLPQVGDRSYIKNSAGLPVCVIQFTKIAILPFSSVSLEFAVTEAWDDLTLESWAKVHREYFLRLFPEFTDNMYVICINFTVLHRFQD